MTSRRHRRGIYIRSWPLLRPTQANE